MKFYGDKFQILRKEAKINEKKKGITLKEVAKELFTTQPTISRWIRGTNTPSKLQTRKLAELLRVEVSEISDLEEGNILDERYSESAYINLKNKYSALKNKLAEQESKKKFYKRQVEILDDCVYIKDSHLRILSRSRSVVSLFNNQVAILGKTFSEIIPTDAFGKPKPTHKKIVTAINRIGTKGFKRRICVQAAYRTI